MYVGGVLLHLSQKLLQPFHVFVVLRRGVRRGVDTVGASEHGDAPGIHGLLPASGLFDSGGTLEAALSCSVTGIRLSERVEVGKILEDFVLVILFVVWLALISHHMLLREKKLAYICMKNYRILSVSEIGVPMDLPSF